MSTDDGTLRIMARQATVPMTIVIGKDDYLASRSIRECREKALRVHPDAELVDVDAASDDRYAFEEAVGPSLFSSVSIVTVSNLAYADEGLRDSMVDFCRSARGGTDGRRDFESVVIARHDGGAKGRGVVNALVKAGAVKVAVPDLTKPEAQLNFVLRCFERRRKRVTPEAAQQLVAVLGESVGELAAMCEQLCDDFPCDPLGVDTVSDYLTANPRMTGFAVADKAMSGNAGLAVSAARDAVAQGVQPLALIGALAMTLRTMAKVSAIREGTLSASEAGLRPWAVTKATRQLRGWTSEGMCRCVRLLADADEAAKGGAGDPMYALERSVIAIAARGREDVGGHASI